MSADSLADHARRRRRQRRLETVRERVAPLLVAALLGIGLPEVILPQSR